MFGSVCSRFKSEPWLYHCGVEKWWSRQLHKLKIGQVQILPPQPSGNTSIGRRLALGASSSQFKSEFSDQRNLQSFFITNGRISPISLAASGEMLSHRFNGVGGSIPPSAISRPGTGRNVLLGRRASAENILSYTKEGKFPFLLWRSGGMARRS